MNQLKGKIEAVLFLTGKALNVKEIADKLDESVEDVEAALLELIRDYSCRNESSLEIDDSEGYIIQIKESYQTVVEKMVPLNLSIAALRTLSMIALHSPLSQASLIEARGSSAYEHIKELMQHKLVSKKRKERSYTLNVTPKFYEYFKFTGDKNELKAMAARMSD